MWGGGVHWTGGEGEEGTLARLLRVSHGYLNAESGGRGGGGGFISGDGGVYYARILTVGGGGGGSQRVRFSFEGGRVLCTRVIIEGRWWGGGVTQQFDRDPPRRQRTVPAPGKSPANSSRPLRRWEDSAFATMAGGVEQCCLALSLRLATENAMRLQSGQR